MTNAIRVYGLGALLLGLVGIAFADFALQWQPVADSLPYHRAIAYASGAILALAGAALWLPRTRVAGAGTLFVVYAFWVVVLHGPRVLAHPAALVAWLGFCEILALAAGGLIAFTHAAYPGGRRSAALQRIARCVFGGCLLVFGASHFVFAQFTASMIPAWIPGPLFFAYLTGCGHVAAGVAIVSGVMARVGAMLLALMFSLFVLLLHIPRVAADPHSHAEWTMLAIALSLTGAAWIVACSIGATRLRRGR